MTIGEAETGRLGMKLIDLLSLPGAKRSRRRRSNSGSRRANFRDRDSCRRARCWSVADVRAFLGRRRRRLTLTGVPMTYDPSRPGIPTLYNGIQFRSRLEAKWAAFFDLLGWEYEYEPSRLGRVDS